MAVFTIITVDDIKKSNIVLPEQTRGPKVDFKLALMRMHEHTCYSTSSTT